MSAADGEAQERIFKQSSTQPCATWRPAD